MSYVFENQVNETKKELKGHQIIGELRLIMSERLQYNLQIEGSPDHWWVTSELKASYSLLPYRLKGHQIIGELRPVSNKVRWYLPRDWRVTRSLVSYVTLSTVSEGRLYIEGSPDHWWVTSEQQYILLPPHWRVTRSLVSYVYPAAVMILDPEDWRVTRSLVSYVFLCSSCSITYSYWRVTRSLVSYVSIRIST